MKDLEARSKGKKVVQVEGLLVHGTYSSKNFAQNFGMFSNVVGNFETPHFWVLLRVLSPNLKLVFSKKLLFVSQKKCGLCLFMTGRPCHSKAFTHSSGIWQEFDTKSTYGNGLSCLIIPDETPTQPYIARPGPSHFPDVGPHFKVHNSVKNSTKIVSLKLSE